MMFSLIYVSSNLLVLFIYIGAFRCTSAQNGGTKAIEITADTFEIEVAQGPHFIMFYAPWCGHCKRLHPVWDQLAEKYNLNDGVRIGMVDCTVHTSICAQHEVNGYPTLKLFMKGTDGSIKYRGPRDLRSLQEMIQDNLDMDIEDENEDFITPENGLVEFTGESFKLRIHSGKFFIKFYAPWCGHCKRLEPTWTALAASSFSRDSSVVIGKLDCTKYKSDCDKFSVKGFPTLLWIQDGKMIAKYSGDRSLDDLKRFVVNQLGVDTKKSDEASPSVAKTSVVVTLTSENFENAIGRGWTFVKYFAPWCGHCKTLAPIYEELAKKFLSIPSVTIAKVDCTLNVNKELCSQEKVTGFPTLHLYKEGQRVTTYSGDRSLDDMAEFVASKMGRDEL